MGWNRGRMSGKDNGKNLMRFARMKAAFSNQMDRAKPASPNRFCVSLAQVVPFVPIRIRNGRRKTIYDANMVARVFSVSDLSCKFTSSDVTNTVDTKSGVSTTRRLLGNDDF